MDYFDLQDRTRHLTHRLIFCYMIAVLLLALSIYLVVWGFGFLFAAGPFPFLNPVLMLEVFGAVILFVLLGTLWKIWILSQGGGTRVAWMLGARRINPSTDNALERRLYDVVEEAAIALGVPVPDVYLLDRQLHVNAFSAGYDADTAVIGLTRGALEVLDRDELQSVVVREFSHILDNEIRLSLRLIGMLFGLQMITMTGLLFLRRIRLPKEHADGSSLWQAEENVPFLSSFFNSFFEAAYFVGYSILRILVGLVFMFLGGGLIVLGSLGMFFGIVIKWFLCKDRAYRADGFSFRVARNPFAVTEALKKVGCPRVDSIVDGDYALGASHLFFASVLGKYDRINPFSTHPSLVKRIKRLEPTFDGHFPNDVIRHYTIQPKGKPSRTIATPPQPPATPGGGKTPSQNIPPRIPVKQEMETKKDAPDRTEARFLPRKTTEIVGLIGAIDAEQLDVAVELLDTIPQELLDAVHATENTVGIVYVLLLDPDPSWRQEQWDLLEGRITPELAGRMRSWSERLDRCAPQSRIPLAQMAVPPLRLLEPDAYRTFRENVHRLIKADGRLNLMEFTIQAMLLRPLDIHFGLKKPHRTKYYGLVQVEHSLVLVLSHLAYAGHDDEEAEKTFRYATRNLGLSSTMLPRTSLGGAAWDAALKELLQVMPDLKRRIACSLIECVCYDGRVTAREGELLRAVLAAMDCPMPSLGSAHNRNDIYALDESDE